MKQSWISTLVIGTTVLTLLACSGSVRQRTDVYPGNHLKEQWTEVKDSTRSFVRDGKYISFYDSGEEQTTGEYRHGLKTGLWITKSKSGRLIEWQDYVDGKLHGLSVSYYENRNKKHEGRLRHDQRHGRWSNWYENGNLKDEADYKNDRRHGVATSWHENGQKKEESHYRNGTLHGPYVSWLANGLRQSEGWFENGKKHGLWTTWDDMGLVLATETYAEGELLMDTTVTTGTAQVSD